LNQNNSFKLQSYVDMILGSIAVILSMLALFYPEITITTMILIASLALFILSLPRIITGIFLIDLPNGLRALNAISGSIALVVSTVALLNTNLETQALIYLISLGLVLIGTVRLSIGIIFKIFPSWIRTLSSTAGCFTIIIGVLPFIFPDFESLELILMISISLLLNGVIRIIQGLTKPK